MQPIVWSENKLIILDQTLLPRHEIYIDLTDYRQVIRAIKSLQVRGAPAIGIAAAYGIALGAIHTKSNKYSQFAGKLDSIIREFAASRPTAVNLFHAVDRMKKLIRRNNEVDRLRMAIVNEAIQIHLSEEKAMAALSELGAVLIKDGYSVLTHCNTGQLATGVNYGTALGIIKYATEQGKKVHVYVDETRPLLQGARLTAWELTKLNIEVILITDNMAGYLLNQGKINCVLVGADRIAANGDTANKIGTYSISVLSRENRVPFYIAAPTSTLDISKKTGKNIPIEERDPKEVTHFYDICIAPPDVSAINPAFDITPGRNITAIITDKGIIKKPYKSNIIKLFKEVNNAGSQSRDNRW
jgi:methylthioribose-1-phosphate isomerase